MHDCRLVASGCPRDEGMSPASHQGPSGAQESWSTQTGHRRLLTQLDIARPLYPVLKAQFWGVPFSSSLPSLRSILPAAHGGETRPESGVQAVVAFRVLAVHSV